MLPQRVTLLLWEPWVKAIGQAARHGVPSMKRRSLKLGKKVAAVHVGRPVVLL